MNQKDRAISLGLKINSLKGNYSVAKSVISDLEKELNEALIDKNDKIKLLELYKSIVEELKELKSPFTEEVNRFNQLIEDVLNDIKNSKSYIEADSLEGRIIFIKDELKKSKILKKEDKTAVSSRLENVTEKHKAKIGIFLKRNFEQLLRIIKQECNCDNSFHISVVVKKYNEIVKKTPLFNDDRHTVQAMLDTYWQMASSEIKEYKRMQREDYE